MPSYPNREHENADRAARRRLNAALETLAGCASEMQDRLRKDHELYGTDMQRFTEATRVVGENLAVLETLRDVRTWHAADEVERARV